MIDQHVLNEISQAIEEAHGLSPDDLTDELLASAKPVVLRGLVTDWTAVKQARQSDDKLLSYLQQFDSGHVVTALCGPAETAGRIFYNDDLSGFNFEYQRIALGEALQKIHAGSKDKTPPSIYVGSTNVDHWLPGFREQNDLPLEHLAPLVSIWLGNQSRVAAHYDFPSNIACVVTGRRRIIVFPPEQLANLYVGPLDFTPAGQAISLVDFSKPDHAKFPKFRQALESAQIATLEPGDAIIIPSMWWHHFEALSAVNVLVNYWWRSSPEYMGPPLSVLQHALLGLRDLPRHQREQWRDIFEHYVFSACDENIEHIPQSARGVLNPMNEQTAQNIRAMLRNKLL